jgi:hypothetical protein
VQVHPINVWIPDNPPERQYTCPKCKKGVRCTRIGESFSYTVANADDGRNHDCKYKGPIEIKLLGYRPPKAENKDGTDIRKEEEHTTAPTNPG